MVQIISVDNSGEKPKLIVNAACLIVKEFKDLRKKSKSDSPFIYLWCMYDPESPYMNAHDEIEREKRVDADIEPFDKNDVTFCLAEKKARMLYDTPAKRALIASINDLNALVEYLNKTPITDDNLAQRTSNRKALPTWFQTQRDIEKAYTEEVSKARGNTKFGRGELD